MKILGRVTNKKLAISEYNRAILNDYIHDIKNDGHIIAIESRSPESKQARRYYHGAVIPLYAYLNGYDYRDSEILGFLHKHLAEEFNGEIVMLDGKQVKKGKSTKGLLTKNDQQGSGYVDRVIDYLEEQYGIDRNKVLNTEHYQDFIDRVYMNGQYEDYIDYLKDLGFLSKQKNELI